MSDNKRPDLDKADDGDDTRAEDTVTEAADAAPDEATAPKPKPKTEKAAPVAEESEDDEDTVVVPRPRKRPQPRYEDEYDDYEDEAPRRRPAPRRPSPTARGAGVSPAALVATVIGTVVVIALLAASITFGLLWNSKRGELADMNAAKAQRAAVEKVAGDYAVGAASIDYKDPTKWSKALTAGVSPDLEKKLNSAQEALTQILTPLQWQSNAELMDAVVQSESSPMYTVNAYVRVNTRTAQMPNGQTSIIAYALTIKKDGDKYEITDVGGSALGAGGTAAQAPSAGAPAPSAPAAPTQAPTGGN